MDYRGELLKKLSGLTLQVWTLKKGLSTIRDEVIKMQSANQIDPKIGEQLIVALSTVLNTPNTQSGNF
jgi:hypothetical protein